MNDCIIVKHMHRVDIDATLKVTQVQGHKVNDQGQICNYVKNCLGYKSETDDWVFTRLIHSIHIHATLKVT